MFDLGIKSLSPKSSIDLSLSYLEATFSCGCTQLFYRNIRYPDGTEMDYIWTFSTAEPTRCTWHKLFEVVRNPWGV